MFQALLNVVNHSAQTSAAALFICCSYVSSYLGFRKGKDASIKGRETDHLVRGQAGKMHFCLPAWISARKTRSHKMISVSILKSMNNKWIHFKARLTPFTGPVTKAGSLGSHHAEHKHSHWHYFILPNYDFLCVLQNTITASMIGSIFAFEKQQWSSQYDHDY